MNSIYSKVDNSLHVNAHKCGKLQHVQKITVFYLIIFIRHRTYLFYGQKNVDEKISYGVAFNDVTTF